MNLVTIVVRHQPEHSGNKEQQHILISIASEQGHKIFKTSEIAKRFKEFYTKLYNLKLASNNEEEDKRRKLIRQYIKEANLPILEEEVINMLESPISIDELKIARKQSGQSPGP